MRCFIGMILMLISCHNNSSNTKVPPAKTDAGGISREIEMKKKTNRVNWRLSDFYSNNNSLSVLVDSLYSTLNSSEKAAQMIMVATSEYKGIGESFPEIFKMYKERVVGSVLFLKGRKSEFTREISMLNKTSKDNKILPAVFACDCEPTLFHKRFIDADSLTPTSELGTVQDVSSIAVFIATEMKKIGIHWNFAPVADRNENLEIINKRSFGNNDRMIVEKSTAFIKSSQLNNIASSLKHFPGHGVVKGDSHKEAVYIDSSFKELNNFSAIIQKAKPVSVMIGHITIRNIPGFNTSGLPSSLSSVTITRILRDSLGFKGIVVSDAMNMKAVKNIKDADFRAVLAGNDLILIPNQPRDLHRRIVMLLNEKSDRSKKVAQSIKKIIRLKVCLGLM